MNKLLIIFFLTIFLTGCEKNTTLNTQESEPTIVSTQVLETEQSTSSDDYFNSFSEMKTFEMSNSDGVICTLSFPDGTKCETNNSTGIVESVINDNYVTFELFDSEEDAKQFAREQMERYIEKTKDSYDESVSFPLTEQNVDERKIDLARFSTKDESIIVYYGIITLKKGCVFITYDASGNTISNEEVLGVMISVIDK